MNIFLLTRYIYKHTSIILMTRWDSIIFGTSLPDYIRYIFFLGVDFVHFLYCFVSESSRSCTMVEALHR